MFGRYKGLFLTLLNKTLDISTLQGCELIVLHQIVFQIISSSLSNIDHSTD